MHMLLDELKRLVVQGESDRLEFKKSTGQKFEAGKAVCAMLNSLGGFVLFGVSDDGKIIGQQVSNKTLEDLAIDLKKIEPPSFPEIETVSVGNSHQVIVIRVSGEKGTYSYDGRIYIRHGPTTQIMPRTEYERRLLERLHATHRWENRPVPEGISINDLDEEAIRTALFNAIKKGRIEEPEHDDIESILIGFQLIHEDRLLNAALALFGKERKLKTLFPQFSIRLARFRGIDRLADFHDSRVYWGHAFNLLHRGETFLLDHIPIAGKVISGKMVREDTPMYPPRAFREALANAICHRDYASASGTIAVAMYDDHLEVINPGSFHFGFTPEKLTHRHASKPWNPIIADVFYRAGIIEQWGTGTLNILDWCKENHNPPPIWEQETESVVLTFSPSTVFSPREIPKNQTRQVTRQETRQVTRQVRTQDGIAQYCQTPRTAKEIMEFLGLKDRESFYKLYLKPMLETKSLLMTVPDNPKSRNQKYYANPIQQESKST